MALSSLHFLVIFCSTLLFSNSVTYAKPVFRPGGLVLPVTKDASTLQYLTVVNQRTPLETVDVVVDLGGQFLWVACDQFYESSSSFVPARCGSSQCSIARSESCEICYLPPRPGCNNNTCSLYPGNTVRGTVARGDLSQDVFAIQSTDGKNPGRVLSVPRFLFTCGTTYLLDRLASGAHGMVGLGREPMGFPSQLAAKFNIKKKFAICLPSTLHAPGVIFFGNTPYTMLSNVDISIGLSYTPLLINPVSTASWYITGRASTEYFIGVKSIKVSGNFIPLNATLLKIRSDGGYGGTKISTVDPYTVLETSIYKALTGAFVREANLTRVASVAPFEFCFSSKNVPMTHAAPLVPSIDLVLQSKSVVWRIHGANSMVQVRPRVMCLGFVEATTEYTPRTSIVIGAHQLEDNLLQFDLATSQLGFSSTLLYRELSCTNFNFTSIA